ncbi:hypothetical protein TD95_005000 [Thielaviopsis punctulata]|uniref:tRNA (guanine-N(7)-)-methyltransferase n=1 Tax=Thielaviopsis punctulata TaxID=72032 RepID=A0A0F4ZA83_9PEZI|nr:hypothetical protein TD95_005000 [Thielaviopsis punctulata]
MSDESKKQSKRQAYEEAREGEGAAELPRKRFYRQRAHANPFSDHDLTYPISPRHMDWSEYYPDFVAEGCKVGDVDALGLPAPIQKKVEVVDIGCGFGGLLVSLAPLLPDTLMLGMEIRTKVAKFVQDRIVALRKQNPDSSVYKNIGCIRANSMKFLPNFFEKAQLSKIFICFPDPHFKTRKHKARIVSATLNSEYAYALRPGGIIYTITDVEDLHIWMVEHLDAHPAFERISKEEEEADVYAKTMATATEESHKVDRNNGPKFVALYRRLPDPECRSRNHSPGFSTMALKGRDMAIASVVVFIAWGHAIHWLPMLRWLGYAFVAGSLATVLGGAALVLTTARSSTARRSQRSERPSAVVFSDRRIWAAEVAALKDRQTHVKTPVYAASEKVSKTVDTLLEYIIRDFVNSWYSKISSDPAFLNEVDNVLRVALCSLRDRLMELDLVDVIISRIVPILTNHIRDFRVAEVIVRGRKLNRSMTETEELDLAIASKFRDGELHAAASLSFPDMKMIQQDYLRTTVAKMLLHLLPPQLLTSRAVTTIIRELVACAVMSPIMGLLCEPDTWNQLMENVGRSMLQDRSTVRRLRAALDEHAPNVSPASKGSLIPLLAPGDTERQFEKFIRAIRRINNLSDARRFRSQVASQLKRDSQQDNPDAVYLRRLEMGKRALDQKVQYLISGNAAADRRGSVPLPFTDPIIPTVSRLETASLAEILRDASGMSYFMEYMDRQRQMPLVQFWLVVDGFRNPLEDDGLDDQLPTNLPQWKEADRLDLQQMYQAYLSRPELKVTHQYRDPVREFLSTGPKATAVQYYRARKAILAAQTAVLEQMQSLYFQSFKKSDLFYKCLASQEASAVVVSRPMSPEPSQQDPLSTSFPIRPSPKKRSSPSFNIGRVTKPARTHKRGNSIDNFITPSRLGFEEQNNPSIKYDDGEKDSMVDSIQSLEQEAEPRHNIPDRQIVKAMEQALVDIMEDGNQPQTAEDFRASLFDNDDLGSSGIFSADNDSGRGSLDGPSGNSRLSLLKEAEKPNAIVESLTRKAELTNNTAELRILRKSKSSIQRELRRKTLQRQHYIIQESDNSLYGRSTIQIKSTTTSKDDEGREFVLYIVEVQRDAGEQMPAATWEVIRRYSEFHELHQKLRSRYPSVRTLDFPRRRVVMKFQADFLRKRQQALEKYLREVLQLPDVCRSRELRAFLSQSAVGGGAEQNGKTSHKKDMITRFYDSVTDGVEDILGNIPVLDQLSLAGQNLIAAATSQLNASSLAAGEDGTIAVAEAEAELNAFENKDVEPFIKPICDIFLEVFELNRGNNWLRGRAVVVVLQQLLGGTIERKVRENSRNLVHEDAVQRYMARVMDGLWPDGQWNRSKKPRSEQEKKKTRTEASLLLATLVPDLAGSVVGRANAQAASRRIFATLNNARLNAHLAFTILDEIMKALFDEDASSS